MLKLCDNVGQRRCRGAKDRFSLCLTPDWLLEQDVVNAGSQRAGARWGVTAFAFVATSLIFTEDVGASFLLRGEVKPWLRVEHTMSPARQRIFSTRIENGQIEKIG